MTNLMLHCGASLKEKDSFEICHEPESLGPRHNPIPHRTLIDLTLAQMDSQGMRVVNEAYATTADGNRFFGLIEVGTPEPERSEDAIEVIEGEFVDITPVAKYTREQFHTVVGLRGGHDQSMSRGFVAGSSVFVCDNLCFSGEVKMMTKSTTNLMDRLPDLIGESVAKVKLLAHKQEERFAKYQEVELSNTVADAAIAQLVRIGAINPSQTLRVIKEWDEPRFEEFAERRDIWRLHNAVTEVYKPTDDNRPTQLATTAGRGMKLTALCDELAFA